jgi:Fe2+ transport system protein FeoA
MSNFGVVANGWFADVSPMKLFGNCCAMEAESISPMECDHPCCPLSRVKAGTAVRIKQLSASPDTSKRLREIGFCEEQIIRLVTSQANFICQVCNARLAISAELAQLILVEPVFQRAA